LAKKEITYRLGAPPILISVMNVTNIGCHWHDALEVIWVLKGEIAIKESNLLCHLKQGDVYMVNYNETHKISAYGDAAIIAIVHIDYRYFSKFIPNLKEISFTHYFFSTNLDIGDALKNCQKFIKELYPLVNEPNSNDELNAKIEEITNVFLLLLIDTFQYVYYEKHESGYRDRLNRNDDLSKEQLARLHRLTHYIYTNCHDKLMLEDIAKTEHYSKFYVSHFIKKAYGLSYQETLCLSRIMISERLLIGTDYTMDTIAAMVGFSTRNQYCQQFKKWHGVAPSRFRKENSPGSPGNSDLIFQCDDMLIEELLNNPPHELERNSNEE